MYPGKGVSAGQSLLWDGSKSVYGAGGGGSVARELQTFPVALVESQRTGWSGVPADGSFFATAAISAAAFTANFLGCYVTASPNGTVGMGLYSAAGNLLAQTWNGVSAFMTPVAGFNSFPVQTPYSLAASSLYYIGLTFRCNGTTFAAVESKLTGGSAPHFGVLDTNGNAGTVMRATFNPNAGSQSWRYWANAHT